MERSVPLLCFKSVQVFSKCTVSTSNTSWQMVYFNCWAGNPWVCVIALYSHPMPSLKLSCIYFLMFFFCFFFQNQETGHVSYPLRGWWLQCQVRTRCSSLLKDLVCLAETWRLFNTPSLYSPDGHPSPDIFYVEAAQDTLQHLKKTGISNIASEWWVEWFRISYLCNVGFGLSILIKAFYLRK